MQIPVQAASVGNMNRDLRTGEDLHGLPLQQHNNNKLIDSIIKLLILKGSYSNM